LGYPGAVLFKECTRQELRQGSILPGLNPMKLQPIYLALPFILVACAAPMTSRNSGAKARVTEAVASPLADLNLVRTKIPEVLIEAKKNPYLPPSAMSCAVLSEEVRALDVVLGPDLDAPKPASDPGLIERGTDTVGNAAVDALRGAAEGLVPFRHWVRKLTGAERHSKEVAEAIAAGIVRRSFLKGVGHTLDCQAPAAPVPPEVLPAADPPVLTSPALPTP
jgi:hypothetical protein